jgi:hypothetical protein
MLDEGVFDHLEARLYPDWLGVKCNRALVPAVREFLVNNVNAASVCKRTFNCLCTGSTLITQQFSIWN